MKKTISILTLAFLALLSSGSALSEVWGDFNIRDKAFSVERKNERFLLESSVAMNEDRLDISPSSFKIILKHIDDIKNLGNTTELISLQSQSRLKKEFRELKKNNPDAFNTLVADLETLNIQPINVKGGIVYGDTAIKGRPTVLDIAKEIQQEPVN